MADHVLAENARSVAHRELPPPPEGLPPNAASLVLFYQYVEPPWTDAEHKDALKQVIAICEQHSIKGRGRCAREGLNCTLTGTAASLRAFCNGLRSWRPALFNHTDFKITDGVEPQYAFKALTIQKKDELVAYGLPSDVAPVLKTSRARHVEADEYHKLMEEKDTVIVDVRNFYETSIGRFNPPEGGAKLIDPQLRNSHEFPKWLNAPETKAQLHGKKVLMYCTGGIRCERASALLDALTAIPSESGLETKDVVMVRGGIERYMKTFPAGGYWKGKNYLFDRRQEQVPEAKSIAALAADCDSCCSACHEPCASYRGQYTCAGRLPTSVCKAGICKVPVIVCASCHQLGGLDPARLLCPLCEQGYVPPTEKPDLSKLQATVRQARGLPEATSADGATSKRTATPPAAPLAKSSKRARWEARAAAAAPATHLFVGNLPFVVSAASVRAALGAAIAYEAAAGGDVAGEAARGGSVDEAAARELAFGGCGGARRGAQRQAKEARWSDKRGKQAYKAAEKAAAERAAHLASAAAATIGAVHWLTDAQTGLFYGSALVQLASLADAAAIVKSAVVSDGMPEVGARRSLRLGGRRLRVSYATPRPDEVWPPPDASHREYPPPGQL